MAKRKRLTPPLGDYLGETQPFLASTEPKVALSAPFGAGSAPIARIAADAATTAALDAVTDELRRARSEGRLVQALPLSAVVEDYLVRDRIAVEDDELAALMESLRARGQQMPIEVVDLGHGRFGLISGWRRLAALRRLSTETGEARFATVQALLRRPAEASDAYIAMVEENEIRVGLSYYERARIVAKAVEQGVFITRKQALQSLFSTASRAKRSKIGSFLTIVAALDPVLRHPSHLGERGGLALAYALDADPGLAARLTRQFQDHPAASAADEVQRLADIAKGKPRDQAVPAAMKDVGPGQPAAVTDGIYLKSSGIPPRLNLVLSGPAVDVAFQARLTAWLSQSI